MLKRTLFSLLVTSIALTLAASAHAAYLSLGTTNSSGATTTLAGSPAGAELWVKNSNDSSAGAFGLYGLLPSTSPTVGSAAVRGQNNATNGLGEGVWGSQAGSGTGVYGYAPKGKGVYGQSASGTGVYGVHSSTTGAAPAVEGDSNTSWGFATGVYGRLTNTASGSYAAAVKGENSGTGASGIGVWGTQAGSGMGVYGYTPQGTGVWGSGGTAGVQGWTGSSGSSGVEGATYYGATGVYGVSSTGIGVKAKSSTADAISASTFGNNASGIYAENLGTGDAAYLWGPVYMKGPCTGCAGPSALQIDDPLDPAHKFLQHSSVVSSQQLDVYSGNVRTDAKGFATVTMPRWFQALNQSFRYQLTPVGHRAWGAQAVVWDPIKANRFTIRSNPRVEISWQVTAVRHDRYSTAHPVRVIVAKAKDQGKYVHPEVYGKPRSDGVGYRRPPRAPVLTAPARVLGSPGK
jgi:hypothetical protein